MTLYTGKGGYQMFNWYLRDYEGLLDGKKEAHGKLLGFVGKGQVVDDTGQIWKYECTPDGSRWRNMCQINMDTFKRKDSKLSKFNLWEQSLKSNTPGTSHVE